MCHLEEDRPEMRRKCQLVCQLCRNRGRWAPCIRFNLADRLGRAVDLARQRGLGQVQGLAPALDPAPKGGSPSIVTSCHSSARTGIAASCGTPGDTATLMVYAHVYRSLYRTTGTPWCRTGAFIDPRELRQTDVQEDHNG